jgi:hypothetical protein
MGHRFLVLALGVAALASAQEFRGGIVGRVTDPTGAAVAGATVEVRNTATNASVRTVSNDLGIYQAPFLLPGNYSVRAEHSGFKRLERPNVRVSTTEQVQVDLALALGAATESVTVSTEAPLLNTQSADLGQVISSTYVNMVAVSLSRNAMNVRLLAPGVTGGTGTYTSNAQGDFSIAGGGSGRGGNEVVVDGIPDTTVGGIVGFVPTLDSVEEVRIHTTMFDAAYGHSNGGAVSITTKSGTNGLHGAAYYFKRWPELYATSWANNRLGLPKPPVEYHQWGYTVGGPVLIPKLYNGRNRTFFTTSLERDHDPRALTRQARVPTDAERQGDFSSTLNRLGGAFRLFDPATTTVTGNTAARQPFANNRIPASRITPIGGAVINLFPKPNQTAAPLIGALNWAASGVYTVDQSQTSARIDHVVSDKNRLFGRIGWLDRLQLADELFPGVTAFPTVGSTDLGRLFRRRLSLGIDDTHMFSPTLVGTFRAGVLSYTSESTGGAAGRDASEMKLPTVVLGNQAFPGWSTFTLGEGLPDIGASRSFSRDMTTSAQSTFTKLAGAHSAKFGVDYRLGRINNISPGGNATGSFTLSPTFTQGDPFNRTSADTSGSAMATLLLGLADSGNLGANSASSIQNHYLALFAQDDWKVTSKLTVNLGVRWELETPFTERYNRMSYRFDETARLPVTVPGLDLRGGVRFAGIDGNPRRIRADKNNFGPRVGLAFSPDSKTVVRAGYGMFYSIVAMNTGFFGALGVFNAVTPFVGSVDNGATASATLANPFPTGLRAPLGTSVGLMAQAGDALTVFDDKRLNPYNQQWQFSVQRELPSRVLFEAAYMGMHSLKQIENFNVNERPDQFLALGRTENDRVTNPFLGAFLPTSTLGQGATTTRSRLWPRFPQFTTLTLQGVNTGRALYHSMQLKADKRMTHGLNMLGTYTFSRTMDNNTTSVVNPRRYRAVSPFDQKHVARLAFTWELPYKGAGAHRAIRHTLGGWALSGFGQLASGVPMSVTHANGRPLRIRNPRLEGPISGRLGDVVSGGRVQNPFFDIGAFQPLVDQYQISPEPPTLNELRAPGTRSLNAGLFKRFRLGETRYVEGRLEGTSVTNTPNFDAPGTNMSQAATFGTIRGAGGSRAMQASVRFGF